MLAIFMCPEILTRTKKELHALLPLLIDGNPMSTWSNNKSTFWLYLAIIREYPSLSAHSRGECVCCQSLSLLVALSCLQPCAQPAGPKKGRYDVFYHSRFQARPILTKPQSPVPLLSTEKKMNESRFLIPATSSSSLLVFVWLIHPYCPSSLFCWVRQGTECKKKCEKNIRKQQPQQQNKQTRPFFLPRHCTARCLHLLFLLLLLLLLFFVVAISTLFCNQDRKTKEKMRKKGGGWKKGPSFML